MELTVFCVIFTPVLLSLITIFIPPGKGRRYFTGVSGALFFFAALFLFISPYSLQTFHVPPIIWKIITLSAAIAVLAHSVKAKRFGIASLVFIQMVTLILLEMTVSPSPAEPDPYLYFDHNGKLLFLAGAFIIAVLFPFIMINSNKSAEADGVRPDIGGKTCMGLLLLMSSFGGLLSAGGMIGLYLFWQLGYLAKELLEKNADRKPLAKVFHQVCLTVWLFLYSFVYMNSGIPEIAGLSAEIGQASGLIAVLVFITVISAGRIIPEKTVRESGLSSTPVMGLSSLIFSLIAPFAVLLKFRPLFSGLNPVIPSLIVFYGALLMVAGSYNAGLSRRTGDILACLVQFFLGWSLTNAFAGTERMLFASGTVAVVSATLAFLFASVTVLELTNGVRNIEQTHGLISDMPGMALMISAVLVLFLFPPFYSMLHSLLAARFLAESALSAIMAVLGTVVVSAVIIDWVSNLLSGGGVPRPEGHDCPSGIKNILYAFFILVIAANLPVAGIYNYLRLRSPSMDGMLPLELESYTGLNGTVNPLKLDTGSVFLILSIILLTVLFIFAGISYRRRSPACGTRKVPYSYSFTAWIPVNCRFELWIRAGWVSTLTIMLGVALSWL